MSDVFILIAEAVYDHGIYGVFSNAGAAVAHGEALYGVSDGHHRFRVERWAVGQAKEADHGIIGWASNPQEKRERRSDHDGSVSVVNGAADEAL